MIKNETFSIRQMIELTGLSEFTIRGWENRYKAFKPKRTETGRREYTKNDVERALLIRELLKRDHKISKIASLNNSQLQELFKDSAPTETAASKKISVHTKAATEALELMALQKWSDLADLFKSLPSQNVSSFLNEFVLPVLSQLSAQLESQMVSVAQEHIISSYLKEKIYSMLAKTESVKKYKGKMKFVLATPEGDHHDLGLLMAHLLIRAHGITSLYLGPHTPTKDLAETSLRYEATHLLITSNISKKEGAHQDLLKFVSDLKEKIGSNIKILMAGRQAPHVQNQVESSLLSFSSFIEFEDFLKTATSKRSA